MEENTDPKPAHLADPAPAEPPVSPEEQAILDSAEAAANEAKESVTLSSLLAGIKHRTDKVLLYLDQELVLEFSKANDQHQNLVDGFNFAKERNEEQALLDQRQVEIDAAYKVVTLAREAMNAKAIVVRMRGVARSELDMIKATTIREFSGGSSIVPDDKVDAANAMIKARNLEVVMRDAEQPAVMTATGVPVLLDGDHPGVALYGMLPPTQSIRLENAVQSLLFVDLAGQDGISPGF